MSAVSTEPTRFVRFAVDGDVARITLDSPANRNALSRELRGQLLAALDRADAEPDLRVIVLAAEGPAFCAGMDLVELGRVGTPEPGLRDLVAILTRITRHRLPVVARIDGPARAGGLGLLAAADLVVAADTVSFAFSEVRIGVIPAVIEIPLRRRVSGPALRELMLTGATFDAAAAQRIGLVDRAVNPETVDEAVGAFIAALRAGGPAAVSGTKRMLAADADAEDRAYEERIALSVQGFGSAEAAEALRARRDKQPPYWAT